MTAHRSQNKLVIYWSIQNGGDGSAYPEFFETRELAELDQEYMGEGWGEPCVGWMTLESYSPITVVDEHVMSLQDVIDMTNKDIKDENYWGDTGEIELREKLAKLNEMNE
jgi:hypothetical protein